MRLTAAIRVFLKALRDPHIADRVLGTEKQQTGKADGEAAIEGPAALLSLFQREGRLVDFLKEDITNLPDPQVGAAARVIHAGCRQVLEKYVRVAAIRVEDEGQIVEVKPGFDPAEIRLSGRVTGSPPFRGVLHHQGWRITDVDLPTRLPEQRVDVVAPAEVEVS